MQPTISVENNPDTFEAPGPALPGVVQTEIGGRAVTIRADQHALAMAVDGGYLWVSSESDSQTWQPGEKERILTVARGLRPADDLRDPGTWFTARQALR